MVERYPSLRMCPVHGNRCVMTRSFSPSSIIVANVRRVLVRHRDLVSIFEQLVVPFLKLRLQLCDLPRVLPLQRVVFCL